MVHNKHTEIRYIKQKITKHNKPYFSPNMIFIIKPHHHMVSHYPLYFLACRKEDVLQGEERVGAQEGG